jgi:hypothetical protein
MNTTYKYTRLSKDDAVVLLVDHQSGLISLVQDYSPGEFRKSFVALRQTLRNVYENRIVTRVAFG